MFTVLVVEDDFGTRKLMTVVLKNAGYRPIPAETASEGLELFEREKPDLVLADIMLPDMSGFRLTESLRRISPDVPIIIVTAKQSPSDKHYGFMVGADDYMTKPVDEEELILRIKALLRRAKVASEQKMTFGELELDYTKMSASVSGKDAELTQKEFLLLFKLLSSLGKIFTRNELMEEIWGTSDKNDHTLNVHINRIREKLEGVSSIEIKSVRGLGYKAVKTNE
ncbi:MAG: response regulator transcription factor [Clostridiales bacterium]|nr:response regulator transcription factor [Clostridiales bacterium]